MKDLQQEWDKQLIGYWFSSKSVSISNLALKVFGEKYWENPEFLKCERVPIEMWHNKKDIFGFVATYMPKLSGWLLATKPSDIIRRESILVAMKQIKLVRPPIDRGRQRLRNETKWAERRADAATQADIMITKCRVDNYVTAWNKVA